jgi:serine/threonine protein kinase
LTSACNLREIPPVRTIGPYELIRLLGTGGMGEVWLGRRKVLGGASKFLAIKLLRTDGHTDRALSVKMFLDEGRLSTCLNNGNIVQVFDVGEEGGMPYMAMEYVEGLDLFTLSEKLRAVGKRLPLELATHIVGEVLKGLAYAHDFPYEGTRQTIVHRDISPHNVMLSVAGEVKLMDFGVARLASEETAGLFVKGKIRYMPPEQLRGNSREPTVDLFAVGAILHELLDGTKFRGDVLDQGQLIAAVLHGELPPLACPKEDVPPALDQLRLVLLATDARKRISSARAAFLELTKWPGYRDAKFALQDLVRSVIEAPPSQSAPSRTEVVALDEQMTRRRTAASDVRTHLYVETRDVSTQRNIAAIPSSEEHTGVENQPHAAITRSSVAIAVQSDIEPSTPWRKATVISAALVVIAVGFGVSGVLLMYGGWENRDHTDTPVVSASPDPAVAEQLPPPAESPSEKQVPESTAAGPSPTEVEEPTRDPELTPSDTLVTEAPKPAKTTTTKVPVILKADPKLNNIWVEIMVGGKQIPIEKPAVNTASIKLKPGAHTIQYRTEYDGVWQDAGRVTVPSTGPVTVFVQSGKATVK